MFFHVLSFSFFFFLFFLFFHVLSFSFIFFHFLSFSFIFFHLLFLCWVLKIWFFLGPNFVAISLDSSYVKNSIFGPVSGGTPLGPLFLFFLPFFSPVFVFLAFYFSFSHFLFISSFFVFYVFHFFFHFFWKKKFLLFFFLAFLSNMLYCWHQCQSLNIDVSSVVGAPWRCGVLTTQGGKAGIGLGRLLGGEHASTPQSEVEAPRLLKRSLPRLYYCCCVSTAVMTMQQSPRPIGGRSPGSRDSRRPRHTLPASNTWKTLLKQSWNSVKVPVRYRGLVEIMSGFQVHELRQSRQSKHRLCTLLHAARPDADLPADLPTIVGTQREVRENQQTPRQQERARRESTAGSELPFTRKIPKIRPKASKNCKGTCIHCRAKYCAKSDQTTRERRSSVRISMCARLGRTHQKPPKTGAWTPGPSASQKQGARKVQVRIARDRA